MFFPCDNSSLNFSDIFSQLDITVNKFPGNNAIGHGEWFAYVHEHGHLVHNSAHNFGNALSYTTLKDNNTFIKVHEIRRKEVTYLNDPRTPCQSRPRKQDMNSCVQHHIENEIGCQLPWHTDKTTLPKCFELKQYQDFLDSYDDIAGLSGFSIAKKTGCLPSCKINEYTLTVHDLIYIPTGEARYSGFFYYPGGQYWQKVYHYNYDFTSYIADVGGLVGLFLGYSMLSVYDMLKNAWKNKRM